MDHASESRKSPAAAVGIGALALALTACDAGSEGAQSLRTREDAARDRRWTLTREGVELYSIKERRRIARIGLAQWIWVDAAFSCAPDLAIGPAGEAVVSSNVVSTLWRIDPSTLAVTRHDVLLNDQGKDVGFTALEYSPEQRAFLALSGAHGSLWRIDPLLKEAKAVAASAPTGSACPAARTALQRTSRILDLRVNPEGK